MYIYTLSVHVHVLFSDSVRYFMLVVLMLADNVANTSNDITVYNVVLLLKLYYSYINISTYQRHKSLHFSVVIVIHKQSY